jgi:hypothetical protein
MDTNEKQYEIGKSVELEGKKYIITGLDAKGAFILKTPYEIRREQNKRYNIGDQIVLDNIPHFISEMVNEHFVLKTFNELYDESCCKVCQFFCKDKGWMPKERINPHDKIPLVFGCRLGQFEQSHNVTCLKKQCNMKNYVYNPREEVRKEIKRLVDSCPIKMDSLSKTMHPLDKHSILGIEIIDVENESSTLVHAKNFGNMDWDRK